MGVLDRARKGFNAFISPSDPSSSSNGQSITYLTEPSGNFNSYGPITSNRPDRIRSSFSNERSIVTSIYTRVSIDISAVVIKHVRLDDQDRYIDTILSGLNNCLNIEANIDQAGRAFRQDIAMTLCDKGIAAIVPVDTNLDPSVTGSFDILSMRVGEVVAWYPRHVKVNVYNENKGKREDIVLPKTMVAIVENPLYAVMNAPNSTLQRLIRKLALLDSVDEASASGKLDLIIQLPYVIKSEARKQQAQQRRDDIEFQLKGSKYGIAYTDGTEKITQLNRPAENNLLTQVEFLTKMLYSELGITEGVMNGTASEAEMLNYNNRTIEPIVDAVVESMLRTFLTKTARSQRQSISYFRDPFKLVPMKDLAELADKLTRNEILSSNEFRQVIGFKPSSDPKADQLVNSNMPADKRELATTDTGSDVPSEPDEDSVEEDDGTEQIMNDAFDSVNKMLDETFRDLGIDEEEDGDA